MKEPPKAEGGRACEQERATGKATCSRRSADAGTGCGDAERLHASSKPGAPAFAEDPGECKQGLRAHTSSNQQRLADSAYGVIGLLKGHFVRSCPTSSIDELLALVGRLGRFGRRILFESLHGAPRRDRRRPRRIRDAAFNMKCAGGCGQDVNADEEEIRWAPRPRPHSSAVVRGGYVNYMQADEPVERLALPLRC